MEQIHLSLVTVLSLALMVCTHLVMLKLIAADVLGGLTGSHLGAESGIREYVNIE